MPTIPVDEDEPMNNPAQPILRNDLGQLHQKLAKQEKNVGIAARVAALEEAVFGP